MASSGTDTKELRKFINKVNSLKGRFNSAIRHTVTNVTVNGMQELWDNTPVDTGLLKGSYYITGDYNTHIETRTPYIPLKQVAVYNKEYTLEIVNIAIGKNLHKGEYYQYYVNKGHEPTNYEGHRHVDNMEDNARDRLPVVLEQEIKKAIDKWK